MRILSTLMIINSGVRTPNSNAKRYIEIFCQNYSGEVLEFDLNNRNLKAICGKIAECTDVLLVFPLYVKSIPLAFYNFLRELRKNPPAHKPRVHVLVSCGFVDADSSGEAAVDLVKRFCRQNGYEFHASLRIGKKEAMLSSPFDFPVKKKLKKLAKEIGKA